MRSFALILASGALGACTASASEVEPPSDQLFFPTGLASSGATLFVANGNSELRFDSGAIEAYDLDKVDAITLAWNTSRTIPTDSDGNPICAQDRDHTETLVCDETVLLRPGAGVRIGNFATDISVQDTGNGTSRLIVPTRGDPSISWVDWNGTALSCNASGATNDICDDTHRLIFQTTDPNIVDIPDEPFFAFADSGGEFAVVTHLTSGAVTLIDSPRGGNATIADTMSEVFLPDQTNGLRGATGIAGRRPDAPGDTIYVGSPTEDRVQMFTVGRPVNGASPFLIPGNYFFLDDIGVADGSGSANTRGLKFSADGNRMYLINRDPPVLQIFDTSPNEGGLARNQLVGATDICREGSMLDVMDSGDGDRAYLSCFSDGTIYVVDPRGLSQVEDIIQTGRGPYAVTGVPARKKLFVSNYLEDTVAVIDTTPGATTMNRVVLRIGVTKPPDADTFQQ